MIGCAYFPVGKFGIGLSSQSSSRSRQPVPVHRDRSLHPPCDRHAIWMASIHTQRRFDVRSHSAWSNRSEDCRPTFRHQMPEKIHGSDFRQFCVRSYQAGGRQGTFKIMGPFHGVIGILIPLCGWGSGRRGRMRLCYADEGSFQDHLGELLRDGPRHVTSYPRSERQRNEEARSALAKITEKVTSFFSRHERKSAVSLFRIACGRGTDQLRPEEVNIYANFS